MKTIFMNLKQIVSMNLDYFFNTPKCPNKTVDKIFTATEYTFDEMYIDLEQPLHFLYVLSILVLVSLIYILN